MKKILAIDDKKNNLVFIKATIEDFLPECSVFLAESGRKGLEIAKKEHPDTIILDIIMPEMDGFEVCKRLKADKATKNIPVIMISALRKDTESRIKSLNYGADVFISKPYDPAELAAIVNVMLRIKEAGDELRAEKMNLKELIQERVKELTAINKKLQLEITEHKHAEEIIHHLNTILNAIRNINQLIARERNKDILLKKTCDILTETRGYNSAWIAIADDNKKFKSFSESGMGKDFLQLMEVLKDGEPVECVKRALKQSGVILIEDHTSICKGCPMLGKIPSEKELTIRLEYDKKIFGVLSVSLPAELTTDKKEQSLFMELAGDISFALHNIEVEEQHKHAEQIQKLLYNIINAVIITDNLEKLIILIRKELGEIIDTTNFYIALYDSDTDTLSLLFFVDEKDKITSFSAGKTLTYYVIKTQKSLLANKEIIKKLEKSGEIEIFGTVSEIFLGVPLKTEGKVTGVIAVQSYTDENAFDESDMKMLEFVSEQISISIDRKKAEQDLLNALERATESDRLKSVFLSTMSHELRTPLNAVIGFSDMMAESEHSKEEIKDFANTIKNSGENLLSILNDMFDITLIETDKVQVNKEKFSVNKILENIYSIFIKNEKIANNKISLIIKKELDEDLDIIHTDLTKFRQILINLIGNAFKFTHQGTIEFGYNVKTDNNTSFLQFYVKDTGIGIPKDKQSIIFDWFRQGDDTITRRYGGTGLGLSISKKLVELLGGKIWVGSVEANLPAGKEGGSTFYFTLAFEPSGKNSKVSVEKTNKTKYNWKDKTILIVDDFTVIFKYFETVLKETSAKLLWAKDGKEAISAFKSNKEIDLVLMDIQLPDINGYEVTKQIKKINKEIPVIAQTAYALYGDREKALDAGCDDYITKPIKAKELLSKMEKCLNVEVKQSTEGSPYD